MVNNDWQYSMFNLLNYLMRAFSNLDIHVAIHSAFISCGSLCPYRGHVYLYGNTEVPVKLKTAKSFDMCDVGHNKILKY